MNDHELMENDAFLDSLHDDESYLPVPRMILRDAQNLLEIYNDEELRQRFRFSRSTIQLILLPLIFPRSENDNNRGLPVPPILKLRTALRYYASGTYQRICGDLIKVSQTTVSRVIRETTEKLCLKLPLFIKFPDAQELEAEKNRFFQIGFPGIIGWVDGTHIEIKSPGGPDAEMYRCRKSWFTINVQVVAGSQYEIRDIVVRWPGSTHDSRIYNSSSLKMKLENNILQGLVLGDSAYPQSAQLFTPVNNPVSAAERRYNCSHKRTRNVVERTIGQWKGRFRCIEGCLNYDIITNTKIIAATAILHNLSIIKENDAANDFTVREGVPVPPLHEDMRAALIKHAFIERNFAQKMI